MVSIATILILSGVCMDNGNLVWQDSSVLAQCFRKRYSLHERGCGNTNVE